MRSRLHNLFAWVMATRVNAMVFVVFLSVMPLMGMIANAVVSLVVLRMGFVEGALIFASALSSMVVVSSLGFGSGILKLKVAVLIGCFLAALVLRRSDSLFKSVVFVCILGAACVYAWVEGPGADPDVFAAYFPNQTGISETAQQPNELNTDSPPSFTQQLNQQLSDPDVFKAQMIQALLLIFIGYLLGALLLGRWFQAVLYNPGGFQSEFHQLSADKYWVGALALVPILLSLTIDRTVALWVLALQVPLLVLGVSFVHFWAKQKKWVSGWLALFYVTLPLTYLFVVILGVADGFFSIKRNLIARGAS